MYKSKTLLLVTTALSLLTLTAYDPGKPGWKLDADGKIEMKDGNPLYLNANGQEMTVGASKISELNAESKQHRERAEAAEEKLKVFEGLDPVAAKKAIEDIKKVDSKKLIDAGEVDKVKSEMRKEFDTQLIEKDNKLNDVTSKYNNSLISGVFKDSEFVRNEIAIPHDFFESNFRSHFKIGEKGIEAYDKTGNRVYSKDRAGEYATPDEALRILVDQHPQKDSLIKAKDSSGSGNQGNGGGGANSGAVVKRAEFAKMTPAKQAEVSSKARSGEVKIVD